MTYDACISAAILGSFVLGCYGRYTTRNKYKCVFRSFVCVSTLVLPFLLCPLDYQDILNCLLSSHFLLPCPESNTWSAVLVCPAAILCLYLHCYRLFSITRVICSNPFVFHLSVSYGILVYSNLYLVETVNVQVLLLTTCCLAFFTARQIFHWPISKLNSSV